MPVMQQHTSPGKSSEQNMLQAVGSMKFHLSRLTTCSVHAGLHLHSRCHADESLGPALQLPLVPSGLMLRLWNHQEAQCCGLNEGAAALKASYGELQEKKDHFGKSSDCNDLYSLPSIWSRNGRKSCDRACLVQRVAQAVAAVCPHHDMLIFEDEQPGKGGRVEYGSNVRQLYNELFLPRMRSFLQPPPAPSKEAKEGGALKVCFQPSVFVWQQYATVAGLLFQC